MKILLATDFSKNAEFALKRAMQFAKSHAATFTVLNVLPENVIVKASQWLARSKSSQFAHFKKSALAIFNKKIKPTLNAIKVKFLVKMGREDGVIIQYAKENRMDLLVVGAHGHYRFHEYFLGTTAESIVKRAPCPVLVVKRKPNFHYSRILVPVDFSVSSQKAFEFARKNFPESEIELLYVDDLWYDQSVSYTDITKKQKSALFQQIYKMVEDKIEDFLKKSKVSIHEITFTIRCGYPATMIAKEVKKRNIDLVVIGTRGQTQLRHLLIGSVAERVLQEISTDIIAVPPLVHFL